MRRTEPRLDCGSSLARPGPTQSFEIWPHRSLGPGGSALLIALVAAGAALTVLRFPAPAMFPLAIGALITVAAMALALWSNNRAARRLEVVEVGPDVVRVTRVSARGHEETLDFSTGWVRLAVSHDRRIAHRVTLTERGRTCSIGECLSPDERRALAAAISASLARARAPAHST